MAIILLLICYASIYLIIENSSYSLNNRKENLLFAVLLFGSLLVGITELLSALRLLNFKALLISWGAITVINSAYLHTKRKAVLNSLYYLKLKYFKLWPRLSLYEQVLTGFTAMLLLMIFAQGLIYPPNNWDSMTYHLARIVSWVNHQTVYHYPTHILRQIYQPPFAEYVIMHFNILNKGDYFANSVQLLFLIFSVVSILLIAESLGINRKFKVTAVMFAITIPMVILQASSTQNDIVIGFFIVTAFYFCLKAIKEFSVKNCFIIGLTLGLGLLTKGTAYLFFAPIMVIWGLIVLKNIYSTKDYHRVSYFFITVLAAALINSGFYYRNYQLSHSVLGINKKESVLYSNQKMGPALLLSSIVKNSGLHMGLKHVHGLTRNANEAIYKLHSIAGVNINDPEVNFHNSKYTTNDTPSDEDFAPNFFHYLLIVLSFAVVLKQFNKHESKAVLMISSVILLQVILFCGYLKWQPYASRLHTPVFLLAIPMVCYAIEKSNFLRKACIVFIPLIMVYSIIIVTANRLRTYDYHMVKNRYAKIFTARNDAEADYTAIKLILEKRNYNNIGLITNVDAWIYPLFNNCFSKTINPVYIEVKNFTKTIHPYPHGKLDCIITTDVNQPFIDYKDKRYYNKTSNHKLLYLYSN